MNARSIRRRTGSPLSTRLVIVMMAVALLLSIVPLTGSPAAAEDTNPQPVQPTTNLRPTNRVTIPVSTPTPEPTGPTLTLQPIIPRVEIDDFVAETPEPTEEIDDLVVNPTEDLELLDVSLTGRAFECTPGVDISTLSVADLETNCPDPLEVTFTILTDGGAGSVDHVGTEVTVNDVSIVGSTSIFAKPHDDYYYNWVQAVCTDGAGLELYNAGAALGGPWFDIENNVHIACDFFIAPTPEQEPGQIELRKFVCPDGFVGADWNDYQVNCTETMNGVEFNAALNDTSLGTKFTGDDGDGAIVWDVEGSGGLLIQETIPAGYLEPVIFCGFSFELQTEGGVALGHGLILPDAATGGTIMHDFIEGELLYCEVFNIVSDEPGEITVVKHTCPAGYDVNASGANPWLDCTEITNGVTFTVQGFEYWAQSNTGDVTDGQAYFGGLIPGTYGIFETIPADTWYAFAYECFDANTGALAPTTLYELENGNTMYVDVAGGQSLVCHFMNVPELHGGTVVLTKYWCDGHVYNVWTCDLYEYGASFTFDGGWGPIPVTTGADGTATINLDAGTYELDEVTMAWCFAEASNVDWQGNIVVVDGETTYVNIYNCGERPHKTPETPGKFPNTGVRPEA